MRYYSNKSIPARLLHAEEIITTVSIDEALRERLETTGYSESEFQEVQVLLEQAQRLETNQQVQLGKQTYATNTLNELTQAVRLKFVSDRRVTRYVLKREPAISEELRLHIKTKAGREALIRQMTHFYEEVVKYPDLLDRLSTEYNLTAELLASRMKEVSALMQAIQVQQYQVGQARVATRQRQEAMKQLDAWMAGFIGMARQAFRGEEANLKKLRIYVQPRSRSVPPSSVPPSSEPPSSEPES